MAGRAGRLGIDTEGEVYSILDTRYDDAKAVGAILHKKPGRITSKFDLGYSAILNLRRLLGDRIDTAVKKSFAAFQAGSSQTSATWTPRSRWSPTSCRSLGRNVEHPAYPGFLRGARLDD